ncbi:MAG: hypothetical protein MUE40_19665 [Anaerolineae bacterium]|jgi:hypothetical protein|nr:hypothetical protein [Anaerolineae bacterium]
MPEPLKSAAGWTEAEWATVRRVARYAAAIFAAVAITLTIVALAQAALT